MTDVPAISYPEIAAVADGIGGPAAARLDAALVDPGAFRLTDVAVPEGLLDQLHTVTAAFFSLPTEAKSRYRYAADPYTGWCGGDYLDEYGFADHKEMYHIGPRYAPTLVAHGAHGLLPAPAAPPVERALASCALWPEEPAGFVAVWHEYYRFMQSVASTLGAALARLLGITAEAWFAVTGDNWADLAANWYPPLVGDEAGSSTVYNAAHRDLTIFTILHQDQSRVGGLAVEAVDGTWIEVEPVPDTYVVNVGELLTFLSGGRWRAAPHQVIPAPSPQGTVRPRISVPFFYRPSDERIVSSFVDNHAEPVPVGAWVLSKKRASKSNER